MPANYATGNEGSPGENAIEVRGLTICARGRAILKDITFDLPRGEMIGILGPNGAGKTTLLKTITGYLSPVSGRVTLFGMDIDSMTPSQRAMNMAIVPQNIEVPFQFSVMEIVSMGRYCHDEGLEETMAAAQHAMDACGIGHLAQRSFDRLSGGERRLVLISRCLCQDSPLFLLDEATSGLDIRRKLEIFELLRREARGKARTIVIVLHDINLASLYLDRLFFIKNGEMAGQGTVEELLSGSYLSDLFETRTIVTEHPECDRPAVLFSPPRGPHSSPTGKGGDSHA